MKPYIVSASRREDIPSSNNRIQYLIDGFKRGIFNMKGGYGNQYNIEVENTEILVFWSKNPTALLKRIDEIPLPFYLHYTLNDYPEFELNVPLLKERIELFQRISDKIGSERMIWRFDPVILYYNGQDISEKVYKRIENISQQLTNYTNKMVFSFVQTYKGNGFAPPSLELQQKFVNKIKEFQWNNIEIRSCAEKIEGVIHNKCIDPELIYKILGSRPWLNKLKKATGQREACGCIESGDIGEYGLCGHNCTYCYAKK